MAPLLLVSMALVSLNVAGAAQQTPKWLKTCYRDDPKFNECALKRGREALPLLVQGDKKLHLPVLDPLEVTEIRFDKDASSLGIGFLLTNVKLYGNKNHQLQDYRVDFEKRFISFSGLMPLMEMLFTYDISGRIILFPIVGHGPGNITCVNLTINYSLNYDLEDRTDGKQYMILKDSKVDVDMARVYIQLDNLFNGNQLLGETTNAFLNENWLELSKAFAGGITEALGDVMKQIFSQLTAVVPFDVLHPLKGS